MRKGSYKEALLFFEKMKKSRRPLPNLSFSIMRNNYRDFDPNLRSHVQIFDKGTLFHYIGICQMGIRSYSEAVEMFKLGIAIRSHSLDILDSQQNQALIYALRKQYLEAKKAYEIIILGYEAIAKTDFLVNPLLNLGRVCIHLKMYQITHDLLDRGLEIAKSFGLIRQTAMILEHMGLNAYLPGNFEGSRLYNLEALDYRRKLGNQKEIGYLLLILCLRENDKEGVIDYLDSIERLEFDNKLLYIEIIRVIHPIVRNSFKDDSSSFEIFEYALGHNKRFYKEIDVYLVVGFGFKLLEGCIRGKIPSDMTRFFETLSVYTSDKNELHLLTLCLIYLSYVLCDFETIPILDKILLTMNKIQRIEEKRIYIEFARYAIGIHRRMLLQKNVLEKIDYFFDKFIFNDQILKFAL